MGALARVGRRVASVASRAVDLALAPLFGVTTGVRTGEPLAALTFDDGPDPIVTPRVLDLLDAHSAKGTFFVLGSQAAMHPEILERILVGRHALGNHTWSHPSLPRLEREQRMRELARPVEELDGVDDLVRPPYGHFDLRTWYDIRRLGFRPITWSGHAKDWNVVDPCALLERMQRELRPGAILLLHDRLNDWEDERFADRGPMLKALESLLAASRDRIEFVTVPELLAAGAPERQIWWKKGDDAWLDALERAPGS